MAVSRDLFSASSNLLLCAEDADEVASWDEEEQDVEGGAAPVAATEDEEWVPPALADDSAAIAALLAAEPDHLPRHDYLGRLHARAIDATSRHDAVNWILKVSEFYRFRPVTACLSVNYLDRFLSSHSLPGQNGKGGWPMQLLSVACVSIAAKMEETHVPLLLDLQILDPRYVFEPRTIQRMELLLAAALRWRLRAVTPFDFLHHLAVAALSPSSSAALLSRAAHLVLSTHRVVDFLVYRPSVLAAAAFLCAANEMTESSAIGTGDWSSCFDAWVSKGVVNRCRQLMEEWVIGTCPSSRRGNTTECRGRPEPPTSPVGVLDSAACASCDTGPRSEAGPEPRPAKRRRLGEHPCTDRVLTGLDGELL
ncbi:hypothetical protein OPV22_033496 [Ensete ventricosum]|uniref:Cyclin N-terminal domain-containing protein n=1 Tax=Ensete ventricosum TaxID=4639 RepID=A0AAV8P2B2_ENSVE|nr:hypothetical protein OPV22_033496 [Ensete ventricosum]